MSNVERLLRRGLTGRSRSPCAGRDRRTTPTPHRWSEAAFGTVTLRTPLLSCARALTQGARQSAQSLARMSFNGRTVRHENALQRLKFCPLQKLNAQRLFILDE